jgi:hypothetical protein
MQVRNHTKDLILERKSKRTRGKLTLDHTKSMDLRRRTPITPTKAHKHKIEDNDERMSHKNHNLNGKKERNLPLVHENGGTVRKTPKWRKLDMPRI